MTVWNYPWTPIAMQYNEAHKEAAFQHIQFWGERSHKAVEGLGSKSFCSPLNDTGHNIVKHLSLSRSPPEM